ncbi:unnamed protein product [Sphagnum compactum]
MVRPPPLHICYEPVSTARVTRWVLALTYDMLGRPLRAIGGVQGGSSIRYGEMESKALVRLPAYELIKSIHLYSGNGSVTAIQREFLLSSGVYAQISEPMPSYLNKFAPKNAEHFLKTLKNLNEADMWHCLLEYRDHAPQATSIIPLLSVSKNPALQHIPTLAEDLALVEGAVQRQQQGHHFMAFVHPSGWNEQQHYPPCNSQIFCEYQVNCGTGDHPGINVFSTVTGPPSHRGPTERMTDITLNELSRFFHMPITQASKKLKVGLTVLKKRCREFGIPRWPHRKMKSLDSLIQNIQELGKGPEGKTSVPVMSAVKELEHQKRRMEERPGIELAERTKRLRQACFKASYKKRRQRQTNSNHQETEGDSSGDQLFPMAL